MNTKSTFLIAATLTAALGAAGFAAAQTPAAPGVPGPAVQRDAMFASPGARGVRAGRGARLAAAVRHDPGLAVILNLRAIERLYRHDGRSKDLPGFYRDQLARTQDPLVRNFVNYRLARLELREDDARGALEALTRNLDENYRRL